MQKNSFPDGLVICGTGLAKVILCFDGQFTALKISFKCLIEVHVRSTRIIISSLSFFTAELCGSLFPFINDGKRLELSLK